MRPPAALATVAVLLVAGCHPGGTPAAKRPFAAYRQCLQEHGVQPRRHRDTTTTAPAGRVAPTSGTTAPDPAAFSAARQACRKLRPAGGLRGGGLDPNARAAFRRCMTDHGVTLPTEPPGSTPPGSAAAAARGGMLAGLNRNDPAVAAALAACRPLLASASTTTSTRRK